MKKEHIYNFSDYSSSLNEGNQHKKNLGILGPFSEGGYKIRTSCPEEGGERSSGCILLSSPEDGSEDFHLSYLYGEGEECDPICIPKSCVDFSGTDQNPILQTRNNSRWWDDEKNQETLDDFLNSFVESKHFSVERIDSAPGDIESILDILGLDSKIKTVQKKKDLHWVAHLEDGTEVELKKKTDDDLVKNLRIYLTSNSYRPEVEISRDSPGFEAVFSTPKGKFSRRCEKITDLDKDPIHKYLLHSSLGKTPETYQDPVVNYYKAILKGHDWRPASMKSPESFSEKEKEINQLKKILSNTLAEPVLDGMYSESREKYSAGKSPD